MYNPSCLAFEQLEAAVRRSEKQILTPLANRQNTFNEYDEDEREDDGIARERPAQTRDERIAELEGPDVQVVLKSGARALQFRDLHVSQEIRRLVRHD